MPLAPVWRFNGRRMTTSMDVGRSRRPAPIHLMGLHRIGHVQAEGRENGGGRM